MNDIYLKTRKRACDKAQNLKSLTVYILPDTRKALDKLANEFGVSLGHIVRLTLDDKLTKHLNLVRYIDKEQGKQILTAVLKLCKTNREILNNIRRIGINYNQEIMLKNAEKKCRDIMESKSADIDKQCAALEKYKELQRENNISLDKNELKNLLSRYEKATKEMEEQLCRILL